MSFDDVRAVTPFQHLKRIGYSDVIGVGGDIPAVAFRAGMTIDADGAYRAYHPNSAKGLDYLANAGRPGKWWGVVTDNGKSSGRPVIQQAGDPAPGYYVSATSLEDGRYPRTNPLRYVDSESVPFFVLPGNAMFGATLGDFGYVVNLGKKLGYGAVFADTGPKDHIGEGSIALAKAIGVPSNPRKGGASQGIAYVVFPGSGIGWPLSSEQIQTHAGALFEKWGGMDALMHVLQGWG